MPVGPEVRVQRGAITIDTTLIESYYLTSDDRLTVSTLVWHARRICTVIPYTVSRRSSDL